MRRRSKAWAALAVVAALILSGCARSVSINDPGVPGAGGFLRIGTIGSVSSLNPWITEDTLTYDIIANIYPKLLQYNLKTLAFEPNFGTQWVSSNHGLRWTFTTVAGAKWNDGTPLTAADVAWTLNTMVRLRNGAASDWASGVQGVTSVTDPSPTTVVVNYREASGDALANLSQVPILPEHVWATAAAGKGAGLKAPSGAPSKSHPIVSAGPFNFVKYTYNQVIVLARNPTYFGTKPHIAGFGVEFFSNDDSLVTAMRAGEIDAATGNPNLPPTDIRPLRHSGMRILSEPSVAFNDLIINTNPKKTSHRELLNPNVRKAFEYATDRTTINNIAYLGYAQATQTIVPPATGSWSDPAVKPLPYNIAAANALLDAAGDKMGPGGIRVADGHQMKYTVYLSEDNQGAGIRAGEIMTTDFAKIGVKLVFQQTDDDALNDDIVADHYRKFDLAMWGWDTLLDPTYILSAMTRAQWGDNSDSGYNNPVYNKLYTKQANTLNPAKRRSIVYRMQQIVANARPYIILQDVDVLEAWNPRWAGIEESPDGWFNDFSDDGQVSIRLANSS
jgi:peptide/nickel transport system substrate-binding protein